MESVTQKATKFISGPWGTIILFGVLAAWAIAIPFIGWSRAYQTIDQFITVASFILLFLIQRSQSKGMLSLQVKLNELLAAAHRASHELINVEDRSESESAGYSRPLPGDPAARSGGPFHRRHRARGPSRCMITGIVIRSRGEFLIIVTSCSTRSSGSSSERVVSKMVTWRWVRA
jgi:low affinity Fe/Cu permease